MIKRLTLPMMFVLVIAMLAACSESPSPSPAPTATVQVAPTATATSTPAPTPSPTPVVPFEDSLSSADLARFQALPVEVQEALTDESLESGNDNALRYLRDMPDDPAPLSEILEPMTRTIFDSLDELTQRRLLLEGYPNATLRHLKKQWLAGELSDLEYKYGDFDSMVPPREPGVLRGRSPPAPTRRDHFVRRVQAVRVPRSTAAGVVPGRLGDEADEVAER